MIDNSKLFEKYKLNNSVEVPGRLVISPMVIFWADDFGQITDEERSYLAHRATGVGLYILGSSIVSVEGIGIKNQGRVISEKDIPSLAERAKIVKDHGALAICQLNHAGLLARKQQSGMTPLCPSKEVPNKELEKSGKLNDDTRKEEMTNDDILRTIKNFANATELCLKAGYDGIEIHGANNFLIQQFYSGYYNKRND